MLHLHEVLCPFCVWCPNYRQIRIIGKYGHYPRKLPIVFIIYSMLEINIRCLLYTSDAADDSVLV